MVVSLMEYILKEEKKDLAFICGQMEEFMKVTGSIISYKAGESIFGLMKEFMKDNGKLIKCMEKASITGKMEDNIQ